MEYYDVVIVGAGPAGGQSARLLSKAGYKILIIDQVYSFADNDYSSGGTIESFLADFSIPETVVGTHWQHLKILSDRQTYVWHTDANQGVVLDFAKLKQFLVDQAFEQGVIFKLGIKYKSHRLLDNDDCEVILYDRNTKETLTIITRLLIDATGSARVVIGKKERKCYTQAYGQEYLIKTAHPDAEIDNHLVFMLGKTWIPDGYTWIFPMGNCQYKVGAVLIQIHHEIKSINIKVVIDNILQRFFKDNPYEIMDKHGGDVWYIHPKKECFYKDKVVAIGDTISAINPLGGEGIRHAMISANYAVEAVVQFLQKPREKYFKNYRKKFLKYVKHKWWLSEVLCQYYYDFDKVNVDALLHRFQSQPYIVMKMILFDYKFANIIFRYIRHPFRYLRKVIFGR